MHDTFGTTVIEKTSMHHITMCQDLFRKPKYLWLYFVRIRKLADCQQQLSMAISAGFAKSFESCRDTAMQSYVSMNLILDIN